ncbi:MAG: hypothetical protein ABI528_05605, partial [bacterium]
SPAVSLLISFIFLYACDFVFYWSIGRVPFPRSLNLIYFIFLILWFYNVIILMKRLDKSFNISFERFPKYIYALAFAVIIIFLFRNNNVKTAYADLMSGTAAKYDTELNERYGYINNNTSDTIVVEPLMNNPTTIRSFELTPEADNIFNQWYSAHFKKKAIILRK